MIKTTEADLPNDATDETTLDLERLLVERPARRQSSDVRKSIEGAIVGKLVAIKDAVEPLITYPGQPGSAAIVARAAVDICAEHIGQDVVLVFEEGNPLRPIITGRMRTSHTWPTSDRSEQIEVDVDGGRVAVTAKEQLVLRCGKASITLTSAGKVLIQGAYVSNRSSGVVRIKGGSIQIN